jgi:hypothetical protein
LSFFGCWLFKHPWKPYTNIYTHRDGNTQLRLAQRTQVIDFFFCFSFSTSNKMTTYICKAWRHSSLFLNRCTWSSFFFFNKSASPKYGLDLSDSTSKVVCILYELYFITSCCIGTCNTYNNVKQVCIKKLFLVRYINSIYCKVFESWVIWSHVAWLLNDDRPSALFSSRFSSISQKKDRCHQDQQVFK